MARKLNTNGTIGGIQKLTSEDIKAKATILIYGLVGAGKTYLLSQLKEKTLVISCDYGEATLQDAIKRPNFDVIRVHTLDQLSQVFNALTQDNPYTNIAIDNITELHRTIMVSDAKTQHESTLREYGLAKNKIMYVLDCFRFIQSNIFVTCLATTNPETSVTTINLPGQLSSLVPSKFDLVAYLETKLPSRIQARQANATATRTLYCEATQLVPQGRCRGGKLPAQIDNPNLESIAQQMKK